MHTINDLKLYKNTGGIFLNCQQIVSVKISRILDAILTHFW